jgi:hypothetical protein
MRFIFSNGRSRDIRHARFAAGVAAVALPHGAGAARAGATGRSVPARPGRTCRGAVISAAPSLRSLRTRDRGRGKTLAGLTASPLGPGSRARQHA